MTVNIVNGYCTLADLRGHLGDSGSKLDADLLSRAINSASRAIDRHCSRRFWKDAQVTTRTYVVDDYYQMWIDDIATTTGVIVKTDDGLTGSWPVTWTTSEYQLSDVNAGIVASGDTGTPYAYDRIDAIGSRTFPIDWFRATRPTLQITATFGWSAVPDEVNEACILKAASLFRRKDAPFGVAGFGDFGPVRVTRKDPDVLDLLNPYERRMWG
ncbi:MAG: head-tail connector protein [bacterium]